MNLSIDDIKKIRGFKIINPEVIGSKKFLGVSIDSRNCKKGDLFIAIKGERLDGHLFVKQVLQNGINCVVVSDSWLKKNKKSSFKNKCLIIVKNTEKALGEIANLYRNKFVIPVIAIAGSNGKTSTKDLTAEVLSQKYNVLKTEGNLNNQIGVPLTLFRLNEKHEIAVIETGTNHIGEIKNLCNIAEPQYGLITNIGKEHLEFLKDIRGAAKAEGELAEYLNQKYSILFLNSDDKYLAKYKKYKNLKTFSFGFIGSADIKGRFKGFKKFFPEMEIQYRDKKISTKLKNIGFQSASAALCAAAAGFYFNVPAGVIKKVLSAYKIESKRRNQLTIFNDIYIIDDTYNSNPDSVIAALKNLELYNVKGSKYIVLGDMFELGKSSAKEHYNIGSLIKKMEFNNLLTIGPASYNTFKAAKGIKNNFYFEDKTTLAEFLKLRLKKHDIVLVKGSRSMKMEEVINFISN